MGRWLQELGIRTDEDGGLGGADTCVGLGTLVVGEVAEECVDGEENFISFISQDSGVNGRDESGSPKTEIWPASDRAQATVGSKSLILSSHGHCTLSSLCGPVFSDSLAHDRRKMVTPMLLSCHQPECSSPRYIFLEQKL